MRNFVQNWFRIDTKMIRNFVQKKSFRKKNAKLLRKRICCFVETLSSIQKSHFVKKRETVAQENLLFRGNPKPDSLKYKALVVMDFE